MTECSELTDQIVNSLIVTLFLLGGWMLSVYGQAGPEMFDSNDDITWELTMNDNDSDNDPSSGDSVTVTGSLLDNELQRTAFLLQVKVFAGAIFLFSACMIAQRFVPKYS